MATARLARRRSGARARAGDEDGPRLEGTQHTKKHAGISCGDKCNCVKVTNVVFLLSRSCKRRSVVQGGSATVESGDRYSVMELAQHQQRTAAVVPTPCVTSLFLRTGDKGAESGRAELWLRPDRRFCAHARL